MLQKNVVRAHTTKYRLSTQPHEKIVHVEISASTLVGEGPPSEEVKIRLTSTGRIFEVYI